MLVYVRIDCPAFGRQGMTERMLESACRDGTTIVPPFMRACIVLLLE